MNKIFQKGLTLIELMAVISLIIIVTGIVFANYGIGRDSLALERTSQKLYQDLRFAVGTSMSGMQGIYGIGLHFDTNSSETRYIIFKNSADISAYNTSNGSANIFPLKTTNVVDWVAMESGVKILSLNNTAGTSVDSLDVFFRSPYPTTFLNNTYYQNASDCSPDCVVTIVLSNNDETRTKIITINNAGMINIQ